MAVEIVVSFPGSRVWTGVTAIALDFKSSYQELLSHMQ